MTDDVTRIGRGVPTPARPPAAPPRRRREPLLIALAALFLGVGTVAGLFFTGVIGGDDAASAPPPQMSMPVASSPNLKVLDEQATCVLLVPVALDAATVVSAVIADPSKADWVKVQKTHDDLDLIAGIAAPELRDDINQLKALLAQLISLSRTGGKMTFEMNDFKASGLRIGARCAKYAS